ncbi:hypothetical protein EVAR_52917_1 [Eumeta japonica]|uniref:Uncharacterized protein n=1 Tax=Eumeta variegata TaxID=151549 RepID=A0A4C1Y3K7_EUMVA|nr:hypothetical protein EVAR_52917_1 [Eumeta japonica]
MHLQNSPTKNQNRHRLRRDLYSANGMKSGFVVGTLLLPTQIPILMSLDIVVLVAYICRRAAAGRRDKTVTNEIGFLDLTARCILKEITSLGVIGMKSGNGRRRSGPRRAARGERGRAEMTESPLAGGHG